MSHSRCLQEEVWDVPNPPYSRTRSRNPLHPSQYIQVLLYHAVLRVTTREGIASGDLHDESVFACD